MFRSRVMLCATILLFMLSFDKVNGQSPLAAPDAPTFQITSNLVFLDVTVLDKKGHIVTSGLTKNDFTITEDRRPEKIFSFEPPSVHTADNPEGEAPSTIIVLDFLNSSFEDSAYIRYEVKRFLDAQPEQLAAPAKMMVIGNDSLEMVQGYTRSRADLLDALKHIPAALPYKEMNPSFIWERFGQSLDALQQISLMNKGVPGRKNVIWIGHGGPGIYLDEAILSQPVIADITRYVHATANMLVDARITLFVIYPGLKVNGNPMQLSAMMADADVGDSDPFAGDVNFGVFVGETGGKLFYNRNDVDAEIARSEQLGSDYYTLTYQPQDVPMNGQFRRIRVSLSNPNLRGVTKQGYFAPDRDQPIHQRQQTMINIAEGVRSTLPFTALSVHIVSLVRHPDTRTADLTVQFRSENLQWSPSDNGKSFTRLMVGAASLDKDRNVLSWKLDRLQLNSTVADPAKQPDQLVPMTFPIRLPRKAQAVRVVAETEQGGRVGSADLNRQQIAASPEAPTPQPQLAPRPAGEAPPPAQ